MLLRKTAAACICLLFLSQNQDVLQFRINRRGSKKWGHEFYFFLSLPQSHFEQWQAGVSKGRLCALARDGHLRAVHQWGQGTHTGYASSHAKPPPVFARTKPSNMHHTSSLTFANRGSHFGAREKEGAFLPPLPSWKFVIHPLLSFGMHLGAEKKNPTTYFMRKNQECNADIRLWQLRSRAAIPVLGCSAWLKCPAWPHLISALGTPLALALRSHPGKAFQFWGQKFGISEGTGSAHCGCFHLLS